MVNTNALGMVETRGLVAAIETHDPDVVVIDLEDPSRDALADMFLVSRHVRRPRPLRVCPGTRRSGAPPRP